MPQLALGTASFIRGPTGGLGAWICGSVGEISDGWRYIAKPEGVFCDTKHLTTHNRRVMN
jgi:hypothetical protein